MSWINRPAFWVDAAERSVATAIVAGAAALPATGLLLTEVNWPLAGSMAVLAGIGTLAKCIGVAAGTQGSPSIGNAATPTGDVVEKVSTSVGVPVVVAGPANDQMATGETVRAMGPAD